MLTAYFSQQHKEICLIPIGSTYTVTIKGLLTAMEESNQRTYLAWAKSVNKWTELTFQF